MTNIKQASLEFLREKLIQYKITTLEERIMQAFNENDYHTIIDTTTQIVDLNNTLIDLKNKNKDKTVEHIKMKLDSAFESEESFNRIFGLMMTPNNQKVIRNAVNDNSQPKKIRMN